ncbi:hypothetical protein M2399_001669 [Pseudomonas sp. BIGb0450]|jgi:hypothetical protein|uniref:hypothetical protein n=1 Tax=unclassified Pseudomonas TaxID=196821 RepID=UPI0021676014|nr:MULTISPECIES: hypothetical protein [unclassified Pseudomonas]MCS3417823.1 hypothetical protein [Pseudomonas sp. BIGb0558]MCS3436242.1 hypothetical protein [Pseudomonas sp. BIGb0450]
MGENEFSQCVSDARSAETLNTSLNDYFAAECLQIFAQVEDLFLYQTSSTKYLTELMPEVSLGTKFVGLEVEKIYSDTEVYTFRTEGMNGNYFSVMVKPKKVWIDVSWVEPGRGGNGIYAAVGAFAANTKREFIGDPDGLSDIATRRRTDAMLSSALKHKTTDHVRPHLRQIDGDEQLGIPSLSWVDGDTLGNIQRMIKTTYESLTFYVPEVRNAYYDFANKTFRDTAGRQLLDGNLAKWSFEHPGSRKAGAGLATLKRGLLVGTLLREEGSSRLSILEQILREPREFVEKGNLAGIFY